MRRVEQEAFGLFEQFILTCQGAFPPLQAFMGGLVAQEMIKALTQKFMPMAQLFFTDCVEVLPDLNEGKAFFGKFYSNPAHCEGTPVETQLPLLACLGSPLLEQLHHANVFMVGVGALGCELLKNLAMLGVASRAFAPSGKLTEGTITITDPDSIELSNLTRQFLFREKHIGKPKSLTAAAACQQMNPHMKSLCALTEKVCDQTKGLFSDAFFEKQAVVLNALDNVNARKYMDTRCVFNKRALLESGTLGPKGHVQVIVPYMTESYGSNQDRSPRRATFLSAR